MFKGGTIWDIFWQKFPFFGKSNHFYKKIWHFLAFLARILFLGINLAKIINSVLFNIKIFFFVPF